MTTNSSIILNETEIIPAPYVSSTYSYIKSGEYIIGGTLNITLDGTLVSKDIISKINSIVSLSSETNCINLIVGCSGSADFIEGAGKISDVSINVSDDSPFTASYSITISLETVNGKPAVSPDKAFLNRFGITDASFLKSYEEQITVDGDANIIGYIDNIMMLSKSFIKTSGNISIASSTTAICGDPSFNGNNQSFGLLKKRFESLTSFSFNEPNHPLSQYAGWTKWLDNKSITIDDNGTISCSFDIYLTKGSCSPMARVDIRTEDKLDHKGNNRIPNRSISGTINGLSLSTTELLDNKTRSNERLSNAFLVFSTIQSLIENGSWPGESVVLSGEEGCEIASCPQPPTNQYYQRLSSNVSVSKVAGEISFSAEFGPTSGCQDNELEIDSVVEQELPVVRYKEFIIPNSPEPVIQYLGDTPARTTITTQGSIKNCDKTLKPQLEQKVKSAFNTAAGSYFGWLKISEQTTDSKFGYKKTATFIKCG